MSTDKRHLWERGDQWYLRVHIPRPLQKHFFTSTGKPKHHIVEPLGDSLSQARLKRNRRVAVIEGVFARLRAGEAMTPDQIDAAIKLDLEGIAEQQKVKNLTGMPIRLDEYRRLLENVFESEIKEYAKSRGIPLDSDLYNSVRGALLKGRQSAFDEAQARLTTTTAIPETTETINQAAEAWFTEKQRNPVRQQTLEGHKLYVRAAIDFFRDVPLPNITRDKASDFRDKISIGRSNRTVNKYVTTLASVFNYARKRGRFTGENPFEGLRRKAGDKSYSPFTVPELQTLFDSLKFETSPKKHSPETALPWVSLIAAFTGMRLEEITQLKAADIHDEQANGATVTVIDIHKGTGYNLKTDKSTPRLVPVHSQLVRGGLLDYVTALPEGSMLFPGLTRRKSKGNKIGPRVGEIFRKRLQRLDLKREGLCFHSFRHSVGDVLRKAGIPEDDRAALLGHKEKHITSRIYGHDGPGLKRLAGIVEAITYPGLKISQ
jgi:integrase